MREGKIRNQLPIAESNFFDNPLSFFTCKSRSEMFHAFVSYWHWPWHYGINKTPPFLHFLIAKGRTRTIAYFFFFFNIFWGDFFFILFVQYSALLHLPPLRFHCADGCWDRTQDRCNWCIGSQTL
jgi:hypothetical protein